MMEIILARHGDTEWNAEDIFRGRADIGLNETGRKQAELLAEYLSDIKIEAIYSSPLKRALRTAETIANYHQLKVVITPSLVDLNFGQWQGLSLQEVKDKHKEFYTEWINNPEQITIPGGESLNDIKERTISMVNEVTAKYDGSVVMVSHRVVNKVIICALLGLDNSHFWNIRQDTCGITTFIYENEQFILTKLNDTSFLRPLHKAQLTDF
ncbi:histidine phosphatase family protein [Chloroflexota bacterium]